MKNSIDTLINGDYETLIKDYTMSASHFCDDDILDKIVKDSYHDHDFDLKMKKIEAFFINIDEENLNHIFTISEKLYSLKLKKYVDEVNNLKIPLYEKKPKAELVSKRLTKYYRNFVIKVFNKNFDYLNSNYGLNPVYLARYFDIDFDYISNILNEVVNNKRGVDAAVPFISESILKAYIESGLAMHPFCAEYNFSVKRFKTIVEKLKKSNPPVYRDLEVINEKREKNEEIKTIELIKQMANYIENGIPTKNGDVTFTIIDYNCLTNVDTSYITECGFRNGLKKEVIMIRDLFFHKFTELSYLSSAICKRDSNNIKHFKNNGIEIDEELIEHIFSSLEDNKIPVTVENFTIIANRASKNQELFPLLEKKEKELILK